MGLGTVELINGSINKFHQANENKKGLFGFFYDSPLDIFPDLHETIQEIDGYDYLLIPEKSKRNDHEAYDSLPKN